MIPSLLPPAMDGVSLTCLCSAASKHHRCALACSVHCSNSISRCHYLPPTMLRVCLQVAVMFAVMNGFIIALILSSSSSRHQYKLKMDTIMASLLQRSVAAECTNAAGGCFNQQSLHVAAADKAPQQAVSSQTPQAEVPLQVPLVTECNHALSILSLSPAGDHR